MTHKFAFVRGGSNKVLPDTAVVLGWKGNERLKSVKCLTYPVLIAYASWKFNYILMAGFGTMNVRKWPVRKMVSISPCINF